MGVRDWLADKWARLRAWAHSVPPDVWIGLAIAAATLLVVWLAYRKAGSSSSSSGLSTDTPVVGSGGSSSFTPLTSQTTGLGAGNVTPPGGFDLSSLWTGVSGSAGGGGGSPVVHVTTTSLMDTLDQNESNGQNAVIRAVQAAQAKIAATVAGTMAAQTSAQNSAILNYRQGELTLSQPAPSQSAPSQASIVQSFAQSELQSQNLTGPSVVIPHPVVAIQAALAAATTPAGKQQVLQQAQYTRQSRQAV